MVEALRIVGMLLSQVVFGLAIISLFRCGTLAGMSRTEKWALALLAGVGAQAFIGLLLALGGLPVRGWWWMAMAAGSMAVLGLRRQQRGQLLTDGGDLFPVFESRMVRVLVAVGCGLLLTWTVAAALLLPTMDYDGIAIWGYRIQVLLEERSLYTASLRDALRVVAQPLHPYLMPMAELPYAVALGHFSYQVLHMPYILVVMGYVGVVAAGARRISGPRRRQGLAAALLLLPCVFVGFSMLSAREPFMGAIGLAAVFCLARWVDEARVEFLLLGGFFALVMQQTKIEGLPFLCGWLVGAFVVALGENGRSARLRQLPWLGLILMGALPWMIARQGIPRAHIDPFMADYRSVLAFRFSGLLLSVRLMASELVLRPELYVFTPWIVAVALVRGWRRETVVAKTGVLLAPLVCMLAVLAIYALRQDQLGPERNVSISRRVVVFLPSLTLAAFYSRKRLIM